MKLADVKTENSLPSLVSVTRDYKRAIAWSQSVTPMDRFVIDGETLQRVNREQGYRYRRRQRYLQEDDRVEIIQRIDAGERQSDLAREYQVTRAAICNTYKNKSEILQRSGHLFRKRKLCSAGDADPTETTSIKRKVMATSPSRDRHEATGGSYGVHTTVHSVPLTTMDEPLSRWQPSNLRDGLMSQQDNNALYSRQQIRADLEANSELCAPSLRRCNVRERHAMMSKKNVRSCVEDTSEVSVSQQHVFILNSRSSRMLLSILFDQESEPSAFRLAVGRLIRLVLEEALAAHPAWSTDVKHMPGQSYVRSDAPMRERVIAVVHDPSGAPLATELERIHPCIVKLIFPFQRAGKQTHVSPVAAEALQSGSRVFVLISACGTDTTVLATLENLRETGTKEEDMVVVCLVASPTGVEHIASYFPGVRIVAAAIVPDNSYEGRIQWSIRGFAGRYLGDVAARDMCKATRYENRNLHCNRFSPEIRNEPMELPYNGDSDWRTSIREWCQPMQKFEMKTWRA